MKTLTKPVTVAAGEEFIIDSCGNFGNRSLKTAVLNQTGNTLAGRDHL
jgi:hypothetical protein